MDRPYHGRRFAFPVVALAFCILTGCSHASNSGALLPKVSSQKNSTAQTYSSGSVSLTITPNFSSGFGPVPYNTKLNGTGSYQVPAPGPGAALNGGSVDFGSVEQNQDYLYAYAVQLAISTTNGFSLYSEANSDLVGVVSLPVSTHLFWLPTRVGKRADGTTGDLNNTWQSASTPFVVNPTPGIVGAPPMYVTSAHTATLSYDYILRLAATDPVGSYSTVITYSVVGR